MKVIKAMLYVCLTGIVMAMSAVDSNGKALVTIMFLSFCGLFMVWRMEYAAKLIDYNNDLYERCE